MRILQISDELPPHILGGSGRVVREVSAALARRGHEVHLLTAAPPGTFLDREDGVAIHTVPELPPRWAHYRSVFSRTREREILGVIGRLRPNIIHAHGLAWQMGYRWITHTSATASSIYTAHGVMHVSYGKVIGTENCLLWQDLKRARWTYNPLRNWCIRHRLQGMTTTLCVSDALRTYLEQRWGMRDLQTLRNGIDLTFWHPIVSQEVARRTLALPPDAALFLLAGRIGHDKGMTAAFQCMPPGARILLAGKWNAEAIAPMGDRVHLFPYQSPDQMRLLYAAADVALVPSIYLDPFPTICLEAMACARPVIATVHGGAQEAVRDGETGWILDPHDEETLRTRMSWCAQHRGELPSLHQAARSHVERHFDLHRHIDRLLEIYERALTGRRPAAATGRG